MNLHDILYSPNAANIQLVVSAEELRKCFEDFPAWGMKTIKERDEPTYYTREELEQLLHVSNPTIISYRKKGWLPEPVTIGGRVLYDKAKVREAMASGSLKVRQVIK